MGFRHQQDDPLFQRHDMMLELGRIDLYLDSIDAQIARDWQAQNDDPHDDFIPIELGALELRARIHEAVSDSPV